MHTSQHKILSTLRLEETGVPIYVQIREQLLRALGSGMLQPGEQMPTMRQMAVALRIDLNTVRHAYDELERMGAISLIRGRGSFVANPPDAPDPAAAAMQADNLARQAIAMAATSGVDPFALAARIIAIASQEESRP
jgi:GntR family transcriptional regulator